MAENAIQHLGTDWDVNILDFKSMRPQCREDYDEISYCGRKLLLTRFGTQRDFVRDRIVGCDVVGISANFTFERRMVVEIIAVAREVAPDALVVVGGHDCTAAPDYYLKHGADVCVRGEGVTAFNQLAKDYPSRSFRRIPGLVWLEDGQRCTTGKARPQDLAKIRLPSAALLRQYPATECPDGPLPPGVQARVAVLETSRGCDEGCSFCDSTFIVGKYRSIPLPLLLDQLSVLEAADIKTILFADDNLLYRMLPQYGGAQGRQELIALFEALFARGFSWTFYNGLQFGLFENEGRLDLELIRCLYRNNEESVQFAGCFRAYIPLETFWPSEMDRLKKLRPVDIQERILTEIAKCHVPHLNLGFIIGNRRETHESLDRTVDTAKRFGDLVREASEGHSLPRFFPFCAVPIPGTPDYVAAKSEIEFPADVYPELYSNYTSVLRTEYFSPLEMTLLRDRIDRELNVEIVTRHRSPALEHTRAVP